MNEYPVKEREEYEVCFLVVDLSKYSSGVDRGRDTENRSMF